MHPIALLADLAVDLAQGFPEAQRTVADGQLASDLQAAALEVQE